MPLPRARLPLAAPLLLLALAASAAGAGAPADAAPPAGYRWIACESMGARLLMPEGWTLRAAPGWEADACSISRTPPDASGEFETGVAVTRLRHVPEKTGLAPSEFARGFVDELESRYKLRRRSSSSQPPFEAFRAELDTQDARGARFRLYQLAIANPATGTVYLIVFRTPAERWERDWPVVEPILDRLGLDIGS